MNKIGGNAVLFSYVPFWYNEDLLRRYNWNAGGSVDDVQQLVTDVYQHMDKINLNIAGVLYFRDEDVGVGLVVDDAERLRDDMLFWADKDSRRFQLRVGTFGDEQYSLAVVPDLSKSIERYKQCYCQHDLTDIRFHVVFGMLLFESLPNSLKLFNSLDGLSEVRVAFIDGNFCNNAPEVGGHMPPDMVFELGVVDVVRTPVTRAGEWTTE